MFLKSHICKSVCGPEEDTQKHKHFTSDSSAICADGIKLVFWNVMEGIKRNRTFFLIFAFDYPNNWQAGKSVKIILSLSDSVPRILVQLKCLQTFFFSFLVKTFVCLLKIEYCDMLWRLCKNFEDKLNVLNCFIIWGKAEDTHH